jgi:hypothetical protein
MASSGNFKLPRVLVPSNDQLIIPAESTWLHEMFTRTS